MNRNDLTDIAMNLFPFEHGKHKGAEQFLYITQGEGLKP